MARETELGFKIKRVLSDNDQWKKIVKETEAFYDKLESNPVELEIGDVKHAVAQLQQVRSEYNKINNDASSNRGQIEFANTLCTILDKAEGKFSDIGVMFKNVNDNTRRYVTGLTNITNHLADSNFGVKFLDVGAQFEYLQSRAEELFDTLKMIGEGTYSDGEFSFWNGTFDKHDLRERIDVLRELKTVQEEMLDFDPDMRSGDFISGQSLSGLDRFINKAQNSLELLRKSGLETTEELERLRDQFQSDMGWSALWDDDEFKRAKENIADNEVYNESIQNLKSYIAERESLLERLESGYEHNLFLDDEIESMSSTLRRELSEAQDQFKVLENLKGKDVGVDFSEVVTALNEIKQAIREIKDAFDPLTQAFANEESAIHAMVTSNVSQLEELINKFKEVHNMVDALNRKDFSITNVYNQKTTQSMLNSAQLDAYKEKANETLNIIKMLSDAVSKSQHAGKVLFSDGKATKYTELFTGLFGTKGQFNEISFVEKIAGADTLSKIKKVVSGLDSYKAAVLEAVQTINAIEAGAIDTSFLDVLDKIDEKIRAAGKIDVKGASSKQDASVETSAYSDNTLNQIKSLRDQVVDDFTAIRQLIEKTFDFSTLDPNLASVQTITDQIYQQFVELQNKINALEIKLETPNMDGVSEAINVIKQEGEAAEGATPKKDAFTAANQKVAASMQETGDAGKAAADGVKTEADAVAKAYKTIANFSFKENARVSDTDFEDFAAQIAANKNLKVKQARATRGALGSLIGGSITFYDPKTLQEIQERYSVRPKEDTEDEVELYRASYTLIENTAKAEQKAANEAERRNKAIADSNKWLIEQEDLLNKQENKYKASSGAAKPLSGDTSLIDANAGVLPGVDKTIDGLANSIRTRIQSSMGEIITQDAKNAIIKDLNALANEIQVQQARTYQSTTLRASSLETSRDVYKQYIDALEADAKKSGVFDSMSKTISDLKSEVNSFTADNFVTFLEHVKKAQAEFKSAKSKLGQETQEQKQQEQAYNKLIQLQDKLYEAKKKLAVQEYGSVGEQELERKVNEAKKEYDISLKAIENSDKKSEAIRREAQLQSELNKIVEGRIKKEEELAWTQREQAESSRIEQETEAAYKERADAIKAEVAAEKELIAAKKESDAFYQQEEKTRKTQEDAAWAEYRAEQEAAAEKERQINLAFSQKAAQEAADAEKELAQARKEANEYFTAVEKQEQKEEEAKKVKELNALYRERGTIITAIIKYNNKAETLKTDKAIQRAKEQLALEVQRLAAIDEEIDKYGELINLSKLEQQNDRLTGRLRDSNVMNAITKEQKQDVEDVNRLLQRRKEIHDNILKLQKQLNDASGNEERDAIQKELDGQNAIYNALTKRLNAYKDISLQLKVIEQDYKFDDQDNWHQAQQNIRAAASADDAKLEEQKQDYKDILNLVEQLLDAKTALHKMNVDPTDKVHTAELKKETARVEELSMLLKDIYGIDIENLTGSLDKNALLTQEQKNKLLEKEREYRQDIIDLTAKAADKAADIARKEQQKADSEAQNYGKADFSKLEKFSDSMHASIRELQNNGAVSATLDSLVAEFDEAYTRIEAMRKQFNENPASVTPEMKTQFQDSVHHAEGLRQKITEIFKESQKLQKIGTLIQTGDKDVSQVENLKSEMIAFANSALDGEVKISGFNKEGTEMYATLTKAGGAVENITVALHKSTGHLQAFTTGTSRATNEWNQFKTQAADGVKRMAGMYLGFNDLIRYGRQGLNYVKEIDLAMTELKKVTDETDASYKQFLKDASSTSAVIGSTISDFTEATATFARLGFSMEESSSMAETAIIYRNVAD